MAKLDFDWNVKVLFESNNEGETLIIDGNTIVVKAAILTLLHEVAKADNTSLGELLEEFADVVTIKEQYDELNEIMEHLGIEKE